MIKEENLNKMYEGLIDEHELTTKELNEYGFNSKDLADLIQNGTLERIKRGYYSFLSVDDLFFYGEKLFSKKEYDKAIACFLKCHELNPNHLGACLQLFLWCIQNGNYEKTFEYLDCIYNINDKYYNTDNDYYLYLLSMITELPEKYREYTKFLKFEDIRVDFNDKRYNNIFVQNNVRKFSLNQQFVIASRKLNYLNYLIKMNGGILTVQDIIIMTLLEQAVEKQNIIKKNIVKLVNDKHYEEVITCFETIKERHRLSRADEYTLSLTKDLIEMIKTGLIPEKQIFSTDKLFEAIDGKNYELALSLSREYTNKNNIESNDNAIYLLLMEIQNLINQKNLISSSTKEEVEEPEIINIEDDTIEQQIIEPQPIATSSSCSNTFADVIGYLMKNDLNNSFITLRNYLDNMGKRKYEFLIIDLIKISLLEGDVAFSKPMIALTYLSRDNFEFNISEYIQNFYETLAQNRFDEARIYLDIISKSNNLGQNFVLTEPLEQALSTTEKMLNYQRNNDVLNKVDESIQNTNNSSITITNEEHLVVESEVSSASPIPEQVPVQLQKQNTVKEKRLVQNDYTEFINQKLDKLYKKGILLLKPMNTERRKRIHDIVKNIKDVVSFEIESEGSTQIVLRYKPHIDGYINVKDLLRLGTEAYKNGDYDTCIKAYRQVLEFGEPKAWVYAQLGFAYMKNFSKHNAIDYLTVATELSKNEKRKLDFTELIENLKGIISEEEKKPHVRMKTSEFINDIDDYYGIDNVEQIAQLVSSGMTFDDACLNMSLDEEQKNIVALIFAKECYALDNYTMGDQYLKRVERTKNKSKFVKSLLEEVRKNKKFYKNRVEEGQKRLILTLKK